uniref:Cadherin domain-containing protein n=1 Tax=Podarcis muralis TaxID=64176 RepID=A0A670IKT0_PODMU
MERRHPGNGRALTRQVLLLSLLSFTCWAASEQIHYSTPEEMAKGSVVGKPRQGPGTEERNDGNSYAELVLNKPLDRENEQTLHLILTALDGGQPRKTGTAQIRINVTDVNDNRPVFTQEVYKVSLRENTPLGSTVLQVSASDKDEGTNAQIRYHFSSIPANFQLKFRLDPINGTITLIDLLDFEETEKYTMMVTAKDGGGLLTHCSIEINVLDGNDNAPEVTLASMFSPVPEDSLPGTVIALINVNDKDSGDNGKVLPSSNNYFKLQTDSPLDREIAPAYNITITATDKGTPPLSTHKTISLQISDINDNAPTFQRSTYNIYVPENNPSGASIFTIKASDPDMDQNSRITYSILNSNIEELPISSCISINSETGTIYAQRSFDYEQFREFRVQVKAQDGGSPPLSSNVSVRVFVLDRNDNSPRILSPSQAAKGSALFEMVPRSAEADYLVTKVVAVDADSGHNAWLSYHLTQATEPALFTIGSHTGEIRTARAFVETDAVKQRLVIMVKDNGQPSLSATMTLNLVFAENFQEALPEMKSQPSSSEYQSDLQFYLVLALAVISFLFLLTVILAVTMKLRQSGHPRFLQCFGPVPHSKNGAIFPPNFEDGTLPYSYQLCLSSESRKNEFTFLTPNVQMVDNILGSEKPAVPFTGNGGSNLISEMASDDKVGFIPEYFSLHAAGSQRCPQTLPGHVASVTSCIWRASAAHGTPFTFPLVSGPYLSTCTRGAFELLGWQTLGPNDGSTPRRGDSNRRPCDRQVLGTEVLPTAPPASLSSSALFIGPLMNRLLIYA